MICFTLPLEPVGKGRPRFTRSGHCFTPEKTRKFESLVQSSMKQYAPKDPFIGPMEVVVYFIMRRPKKCKRIYPTVKPDIDNLEKTIGDAGNGVLWNDDSQIVHFDAWKIYDLTNPEPRIKITVRELPWE